MRLISQSAVVEGRRKGANGKIFAIRMVYRRQPAEALQSVRPGSFGIRSRHVVPIAGREALCDGGQIFEHNNPLPMLSKSERC